jgi:hypothetical protein
MAPDLGNAGFNTLEGLAIWYATQCDGHWEHQQGIKLQTLDNPGWMLKIDLVDTALYAMPFAPIEHQLTDPISWWRCWRDAGAFHAACGPKDLSDVVGIFLTWARDASPKART